MKQIRVRIEKENKCKYREKSSLRRIFETWLTVNSKQTVDTDAHTEFRTYLLNL